MVILKVQLAMMADELQPVKVVVAHFEIKVFLVGCEVNLAAIHSIHLQTNTFHLDTFERDVDRLGHDRLDKSCVKHLSSTF